LKGTHGIAIAIFIDHINYTNKINPKVQSLHSASAFHNLYSKVRKSRASCGRPFITKKNKFSFSQLVIVKHSRQTI